MSQLSVYNRAKIHFLSQEGYSARYIAKKLKVSRKTVSLWKDQPETSTFSRSVGSGRKRKLTSQDEKAVEKILEEEYLLGSRQLVHRIEQETKKTFLIEPFEEYLLL